MTIFVDPARLYSIKIPDGFERDSEAQSVVFKHPDIDGRLTLSCLRHNSDTPKEALFDALPGRENMENVRHAEQGGVRVDYGDYVGELQNEQEFWRWWAMQRGPIALVVSFNGSVESGQLNKLLVNQFVDGISIVETPPVSIEEFTTIAANAYAEALDKPAPKIVRPLELNTGEKALLRLENAYVSYLDVHMSDNKVSAKEMLLKWMENMWNVDSEDFSDWTHARTLVYPVLKPFGFAKETDVKVIRRTLIENELELMVAVDTGRTLRFLSRDDLDVWLGVSEEDVFFYARENLAALAPDLQCQTLTGENGEPAAVIFATGDCYDASRVMLPNFYDFLKTTLGESLLVGVPNRDFMIVLSDKDTEMVKNISAQVKVDCETQPYSISGKLYRLTADGMELL
ncbi:MAG: DUF1444 family protein [Planctomycetes bacterium]|nr:DUF1444 family protein [Planctomycetota bacterium]